MPDARKPLIVACSIAAFSYCAFLVGEQIPAGRSWLAIFYLSFGTWIAALVWLWRMERRVSAWLSIALSLGVLAFGAQLPKAFAFTAWLLGGFAP